MSDQKITVNVNLHEAPSLGPHEWDSPNLGEPATFSPFPIRVRDGLLLAAVGGYGFLLWRIYHGQIDMPYVATWLLSVALIVLNMIRWQGLPLPRWIVLALDHLRVVLRAPSTWGDVAGLARGSASGRRFSAFLSPEVGKAIHANIQIGKNGIVDVGVRVAGIPKDIQDMASQAFGKERLRAFVELTTMGDVSTQSPESLAGTWQQRLNFWADVRWAFSLHLLTRPFPRHKLEVAAGPVWKEAGELASRLVLRRFILAIYGGTVDVLKRRLIELTGTDRPGRLAQAGYGYKVLDSADLEPLADDAYGKRRAPALTIAPNVFELHTGTDDPAPIGPANGVYRVRGTRQWVTFAATAPPKQNIKVGWMRVVAQGRAENDFAVHVNPQHRFLGLNAWLTLKASWWETAPLAPKDWWDKARRVHRHLALLASRSTTTLSVGIYASVPETQADDMRSAMEDMLGRDSVIRPLLRQREGRQSTEPWGRDTLKIHFETDSQTMAALGPPDGGVTVDDGIFFATANEFPQPIMYDPWFLHDDAPVWLTVGKSGSGKTNVQMTILAVVLEPHPEHVLSREGPVPVAVVYFKPLDEWEAFCRRFDGMHIHASPIEGDEAYWLNVLEEATSALGASPIVAINLMDLDEDTQAEFVRSFTARVMLYQRKQGENFRKRFMYVIGEARVLTRSQKGAVQLGTLANQARGLRLSLGVDTQFIDHLLNSPADDVRRNAGMVLLMRMDDGERALVREKFGLSDEAFNKLTALAQPNTLAGSAPVRGMFIGRVHGVWVYGYVERLGELARLGDQTNPALREDPSMFTGPKTRDNGRRRQLAAVGR